MNQTAASQEGVDAAALRGVAEAATRGPWAWTRHDVPSLIGVGGEPGVHLYETEVLEVSHDGGCGCRKWCRLEVNISDADKAFIAAANPTRILAVLDELDALRALCADAGLGRL